MRKLGNILIRLLYIPTIFGFGLPFILSAYITDAILLFISPAVEGICGILTGKICYGLNEGAVHEGVLEVHDKFYFKVVERKGK